MLGVIKSLETLAIRLDRHCENALKVAEFCERSKIDLVNRNNMAKKTNEVGWQYCSFEIKEELKQEETFG
jgi:O-succinylhomoserine sulfhydrylase